MPVTWPLRLCAISYLHDGGGTHLVVRDSRMDGQTPSWSYALVSTYGPVHATSCRWIVVQRHVDL